MTVTNSSTTWKPSRTSQTSGFSSSMQMNAKWCTSVNLKASLSTPWRKMTILLNLRKQLLEKDLGVHVDPSLTFSAHCKQQVNKANRLLGLIRRSCTYIDGDSLVKLFTALVRPHLEYANAVWYPAYTKDSTGDSTLLENVQSRATKLVPRLRDEPYETRLQRQKLPSLQYRRVRGDMIELFKHITGIYRVDADYIKLDNNITRGHDKRLKKQRASKIVRRNFLTFRATNTWNSLPQEVVAAPILNTFKARLDKHWTKFRFSLQSLHELNKLMVNS